MSVLKNLVASIGHFFENLFKNTGNDFKNLPQDQQNAILQGVNVSEIIKTNLDKTQEQIEELIATKLNITSAMAGSIYDYFMKTLGVPDNAAIASKIDAGISDEAYNGLWQLGAQAVASFISGGKINWITLSLGVVEWALQHFVKGVK